MKMKKAISCILAFIMIISAMPVFSTSEEQQTNIIGHEIVGIWNNADNPDRAYDGMEATKWNPTVNYYEYAPGVIFQLDACYDLTTVRLAMEQRYYFDLYVSRDNVSFTLVASVTEENQNQYYVEDYICTITVATAENARFVKLVYTGAADNSNSVNLREITVFGTDAYENENIVQITDGFTEGVWQSTGKPGNAYDGNETTKWSAQATDYQSGESVIFSFDEEVNISALRMLFEKRSYYFTLSVSLDGDVYAPISEVNAENKNNFYKTEYLCTIDGFTPVVAQFVKITFTGSSNGSLGIYLKEVSVYTAQDGTAEQPQDSVNRPLSILNGTPSGNWESEGNCQAAYDGDKESKWNPLATDYSSGESIILQLDDTYDISQIQIHFTKRYYYFDVSLSNEDGSFWTVATVNKENYSQFYSKGYFCKLTNLSGARTKQVKLTFTGTSDSSLWVNFHEIEIYGITSDSRIQNAIIATAITEGTWQNTADIQNAFDGDVSTIWNPCTKGYKAGESAIFTLDRVHDLTKLQITVGQQYHYFKIYVSSDGKSYTQIADVNESNYNNYYLDDYVCTVTGIFIRDAQYIKVQFTGKEEVAAEDISVQGAAALGTEEQKTPVIVGGTPVGTWAETMDGTSVAASASYDSSVSTMWNPRAEVGYPGKPGIVYTLDDAYDITEIKLVHKIRHYYYSIAVSTDGESYKTVATVNAATVSSYYSSDNTCTLPLNAKNVKYIKLIFTGNAQAGNTYVALYDIAVQGTIATEIQTPMIVSGTPVGTWVLDRVDSATVSPECSYDNNLITMWNPQANTAYSGKPGIVYALDDTYDITQLRLIHKLRQYYYTVAVSEDGKSYTTVATVNATTASGYYSADNTCTLPLNAKNVKYIKLTFTGNAQAGNTYVALYDVEVQGTVAYKLDPNIYINEIEAYGYPVLVSQWNLALQEDVQVKFWLSLPQSREENAQIQLQVGNETRNLTIADMTAQGNGRYVLSHSLAAAQMTDEITVKAIYEDEQETSPVYSVRQYADILLSDTQYVQYHNIVRQMLSYGSAAQKYFAYNTDCLADEGIFNSAQRTVPQDQTQDIQLFGNADGVSFYGVSMAFLDKIALYFYFNGGQSAAFCLNGDRCSPEKTDTGYRILVPDINLQDLDEKVTVTATDSEGSTITVVYSPMNYIVRMSNKGNNNLHTLLRKLYNLHLAAEELVKDECNNTTYLTAATDDLGRTLNAVAGSDDTKEVGLFYFLCHGTHGAETLYDISKIMENNPNATESTEKWLAAGGGAVQDAHWWGESLFGYYTSYDEWVIDRDIQMLTDAGVDFLMIDTSNAFAYEDKWPILLHILDKYYQQGFRVPQVTPLTYKDSGLTIQTLYEEVYLKYPQYAHLWYRKDGKPLVVGFEDDPEIPDECLEFFSFMYPQWPRESYHADGIAWMDFGWWTEDGTQAIFGTEGSRTIMTVSLAQHSGTLAFSSSAFYGDTTNHTRSWHDGANDYAEDAYLYGYNFAEQFEYAIQCNPDTIFITGWNEWVAARQETWREINVETEPIIFVDACDINNSRDIQPMKGGYGDNYYLQMMQYIRQFKGAMPVNVGLNTAAEAEPITIDITKATSQWNAVEGYYLDYVYEIEDRKAVGFGGTVYEDKTGRNDIHIMKIANDSENLYAYVQTVDPITGMDADHCMSMFISTGNEANENWCGYDFVVSRTAATDSKLVIEKRTESGWEKVGEASYYLKNNELQFAIPLSILGLDRNDVSIQFKFADNFQGEDDIYSFYLNGDAAPYGRLNYVYESKGIHALEKFIINTTKAVPNGITEE